MFVLYFSLKLSLGILFDWKNIGYARRCSDGTVSLSCFTIVIKAKKDHISRIEAEPRGGWKTGAVASKG
jgi:hypothetical protein